MCLPCKEKSRTAYNQRQRDGRAARPKITRTRICTRCGESYQYAPKRGYNKGVCGPCLPILEAEEREARLEHRRQYKRRKYHEVSQPERQLLNFKKKLSVVGLEWSDELITSIRCGICDVDEPGAKLWSFDHDHSCCSRSKMCPSCFRGFLCNRCNLGLGLFSDDPVRLRRAADWVER